PPTPDPRPPALTHEVAPMSEWRDHGIAGVLLAAGAGRRMGGVSKLLLPHPADGQPLVVHAARGLLALGLVEVVVVLRPDQPALAADLARLPVRIVYNPAAAAGQATSLAVGVAALGPDSAAALVALGDTPTVAPAVFAALLAAYSVHPRPITQPVYGAQPGPPTLFARVAWPALADLHGDDGARALIRTHPAWLTRVPLPAALLPPDIDTPADYAALP
ncbi:MAG: nucleotidyltransferase family protein, partial [Chloroflexota bacterium]|nr:nucleotidyltransferase family protein [Chloroflexota bacterium]